MELQKQAKIARMARSSRSDQPLMTVEKAQCERAKNALYDSGDFKEAAALVQSIYHNHPLNEEVLSVYLTALMGIDEDKVKNTVASLPVDMVCAYVVLVDIEIRHGDLAAAEARLAAAEKLWPDSNLVKLRRVVLMYATARQLHDRTYLAEAMDLLTSLSAPGDKLEKSWQFFLQYAISQFLGDEVPELTKDFCHGEDVYFTFVRGDILGLEMEKCIQQKQIDSSEGEKAYCNALQCLDKKEYEKAFELLTLAINAGNCDALNQLATLYSSGEGCVKNYATAEKLFIQAIDKGCEKARYSLALLYGSGGFGLARDEKKCVEHMKLAAKDGDVRAVFFLADIFRNGFMGEERDCVRAVIYYKQAAEKGNTTAMISLGEMYKEGDGVVKDYTEARFWLEKALDAGELLAREELADLKEKARLTPDQAEEINSKGVVAYRHRDYVQAKVLFEKASDAGNGDALCNLAIMYKEGHGVRQDMTKWETLLQAASKAGKGVAARELANAYYEGDLVEKNVDLGLKYWKLAADLGDREALTMIGVWYSDGLNGFPQDHKKANVYLSKAVEQGDSDAMLRLALNYVNDNSHGVNPDEALSLIKRSFEAGNALAARLLAEICLNGNGMKKDIIEGVKYMLIAAERGDGEALNKIGLWYDEGKNGLPEDDEKAVEYYRKAADRGDASAMYNLALMYLNGEGIMKDRQEAIRWLKKASDSGHKDAAKRLMQL